MPGAQEFQCGTVGDGVSLDSSCDVEAAVVQFLADPALACLALPKMEADQQKRATMFVDSCPNITCECHGFGLERRLYLFKVADEANATQGDNVPQYSSSAGKGKQDTDILDLSSLSARSLSTSTASASTSGDASMRTPSKVSCSSKSTDEAPSEHSDVVQVRGTYVHIDGVGLVEQNFLLSTQRLLDNSQEQIIGMHMEGVGRAMDRQIYSTPQPTVSQHLLEDAPFARLCADTLSDASTRTVLTGRDASARVALGPIAAAAAAAAQKQAKHAAAGTAAEAHRRPVATLATTYAASPPHCWAPGTEVVIEGLAKFPAFNGSRGVVHCLDSATGRYEIRLSLPVAGHELAKVKGENIRLADSSLAPSSSQLGACPADATRVPIRQPTPISKDPSTSPQHLHLSELV